VEDGWQILYFSAKDEVEQALSADVRDGRVQLVRLEAPGPALDLENGGVDDRLTDVPTAAQGELTLTETPDDARAAGENGSHSIL